MMRWLGTPLGLFSIGRAPCQIRRTAPRHGVWQPAGHPAPWRKPPCSSLPSEWTRSTGKGFLEPLISGAVGAARPSFLLAEAARSECAPSMRAVKDNLAVPVWQRGENRKASSMRAVEPIMGAGQNCLRGSVDKWLGTRKNQASGSHLWRASLCQL
jgi:hypothetical protein